jgi:hypothetical protein
MRGIEFEVVWFDYDVIEYQVTCSNGPFHGVTKMYLTHDGLSGAAESLSGLPSNIEDSRDVQLGAFDPKAAGGGISMRFRCVDSVGHAVVLVRLRGDGCEGDGGAESVCLYILVEAGSIDTFVAKARSVKDSKGAKAYLHMADHTVGWVQRNFPSLM